MINCIKCENKIRFKKRRMLDPDVYSTELYPGFLDVLTEQDIYDNNGDFNPSGLTYSSSGSGWWLHKVSSYPNNTKCIRVRRVSDNAEKDFGFDTRDNLQIRQIEEWLNGVEGRVKIFYDQTPNGVNLIQTDNNKQPFITNPNGKVYLRRCRPCIIFKGAEFFNIPNFILEPLVPILSNLSIFSVGEINGDVGTLYSRETFELNFLSPTGSNTFSLGATSSADIVGFVNPRGVPTNQLTQTLPQTDSGDCDLLTQYIFTSNPQPEEPGWTISNDFPTGLRQEHIIEKRKDGVITTTAVKIASKLIRMDNDFFTVAPFYVGARMRIDTIGVTPPGPNLFLGGTSSTVKPNRPLEFLNECGLQGLTIYTRDMIDDAPEIHDFINGYYKWF
jgi:hypothetical protein